MSRSLSLSPCLVGCRLLTNSYSLVFFQVSATQASPSSTVSLTVAIVLERMFWDSSRQCSSSSCRRPEPYGLSNPKNAQRKTTFFAPLQRCTSGVFRTKLPETVTQRPLRWKHAKPNCDFNCSGLFLKSKTRFHDRWFLVRGHLKKCKTCTFEFCLLPFMSYLDMKPSWVFWTSSLSTIFSAAGPVCCQWWH